MNNAHELRAELSKVFDSLKTGALPAKDAAELANVAGKMISSAKVQVEYYALRGETPSIAFLAEPVTQSRSRAS